MKQKGKIYLNPRYSFVTLSILLGILLVLLLPALYKILVSDHPNGFDHRAVLPDQPFVDVILGALAGIVFSIFGLKRLDSGRLTQITRLFITLLIMLIFLTYITIKSIM